MSNLFPYICTICTIFLLLVDAEDDSLIQPYLVTYGNLTCHRCVKSIHGYNCIVLRDMSRIEREHCRSDQHYCMVSKALDLLIVTDVEWGYLIRRGILLLLLLLLVIVVVLQSPQK